VKLGYLRTTDEPTGKRFVMETCGYERCFTRHLLGRRCVFSVIVLIIIIVLVLALLGFFARGRF
jgi:ABC-type sugar transport system permease subunit